MSLTFNTKLLDRPRDLVIINGDHIIWTGTACVGAAISYRVEVVRMNDSVPVDIIVTTTTDAQLSNLQPNQMYSVFVTTIGSTCSSEPVVINFTSNADGKCYQLTTQSHALLRLSSVKFV